MMTKSVASQQVMAKVISGNKMKNQNMNLTQLSKKKIIRNNFSILYCILSICFLSLSPSVVYAKVQLPKGNYHETIEDIRVKVQGGYVGVKRSYINGEWHFNRQWNDSVLSGWGLESEGKWVILRNGIRYEGPTNKCSYGSFTNSSGGTTLSTCNAGEMISAIENAALGSGATYNLASGTRFTKLGNNILWSEVIGTTFTSFRWEDKVGNWIDYDITIESDTPVDTDRVLRVSAFGTRDQPKVSLIYNTLGQRVGVADYLGNQVLWFEYNSENLLSAVRDVENRRVEYEYTNGKLVQVTDVRENTWKYTYNDQGLLATKVDPINRTTNLNYNGKRIVSTLDQDGVGISYKYGFDKNKKEYYVLTKTSGGFVKERWYNNNGLVIRRMENGELIEQIEHDKRTRIITDRVGGKTIKEFDEWGNIIKQTFPDGTIQISEYDSIYSNLMKFTNENGVVTENEYNSIGELVRKIEAKGTSVERITEYGYDEYHNLIHVSHLEDGVTARAIVRYEYDVYGNIKKQTDAENNITEFLVYDSQGNLLEIKDARGKTWKVSYDAMGNVLSRTDPLAQIKHYEYDNVGRLSKEINTDNAVFQYLYDNRDNKIEVIDPLGNKTKYEYDLDNRLLKTTDQNGILVSIEYDSNGRLLSTIDGENNSITLFYSKEGVATNNFSSQPVKIVYPNLTQELTYDSRGRVIQSSDSPVNGPKKVFEFEYDAVGNRTRYTDTTTGLTSSFTFDPLNRLRQKIDISNQLTEYSYDNRDNLIKFKDSKNHTHRFEYNRNNNITRQIRPMGQFVDQTYNSVGLPAQRVDASGIKVTYAYDDAGRKKTLQYFVDDMTTNPSKTIIFSYNLRGDLETYDDGVTSALYTYNILGQRISENINFGNFSKSFNYEYYDNGQKKSFTAPDSTIYKYQYSNY